ncbi:RICIN domain-containing protein [Microtetraspora sp. NBRC 16547]|uniref:RICIN domain-containing protein n=1 Tax=Microtetraspora sp. NBRC 16547 TaxID=3030993 RepID=UPI002555760B|nr:RICIN domain-containing protein [Microtetraspora sp. NBRC 16547]
MFATLMSAMPVQSAHADPTGAPTYRALAGGGSATTQELMNAMADAVTVNGQKVLASYEAASSQLSSTFTTKSPTTNPYCTLNRPAGDAGGLGALGYSMAVADGCLDFARLAGEPTTPQLNSPVANVTYLPYALDGITYVVDQRSPLHEPSLDYLRAIYTCAATTTQYHPLLPASGSQLRSEWLAALNISEADLSNGKYPCVKDTTLNGRPISENDPSVLTSDEYAIVPYSIGQWAKHTWNYRLGNIIGAPETNGQGPVVPNTAAFPDGVSYTIRSQYQRDLTLGELKDIYQCRMTQVDGKAVYPLLPVASPVRTAWLKMMGITEADMSAGRYPCISTTTHGSFPIQPNTGSFQEWGNQIMPYSITEYIRQMLGYDNGVAVPDNRNALTLGGLVQGGGVVKRPFVLNTGYGRPLVHRLYNVVPAEKQRVSPWREAFTGKDSLICRNTGLIETYGFTPLAPEACGGGDRALADPAAPSYRIRNANSGSCLAIAGASTAAGALAVQQPCSSGTEQQWTWYGTTGRQLKNTNSGLCLSIGTTNTPSSAQAFQAPCGSGAEQQWIQQVGPASSEIQLKSAISFCSTCVLSISNASTLAGAKAVAVVARNLPNESWTLHTATTYSPGPDTTTSVTSTSTATMAGTAASPAPVGKTALAAAAAGQWVSVTHPKRLVDVSNGRCRFQGDWEQASARPGSGPIGGAFLFATGYLNGPKCAVTMHLQVVSYDFRDLTVFTHDHYYDASKPSSAGKNERWMFWGPIVGGVYYPKIGNQVYLVTYEVKDLTTGTGLPSVGQIWGPPANWCDGWRPPTSPPGC